MKTVPSKKTSKQFAIVTLVIVVAVLLLGLGQLYTSAHMPVYRDEARYYKVSDQITDSFSNQMISSDEANERFYVNQRENMTNKYSLEKSGWFYVIASAYGFVGLGLAYFIKRTRKSLHVAWLYALASINAVAWTVLGVQSILVDSERGLLPYWADSMGIPVFGSIILLVIVAPITAVIVALTTLGYKRQNPSFDISKFTRLPRRYQIYFIVAFGIFAILLGTSMSYLTYEIAPLIAGGLLYNVLLFAGVQRLSLEHR